MCNPSRISLLWGRRPSSTGFYDNHYHISKEPEFLDSHVSLPVHFSASGYKTLTAGKVFHGGAAIQKHFHVVGPRSGQWLKGLDRQVHDKPKQWHCTWDFGPQDYEESKFTDHVTATWVAEQLGELHDKPFFLALVSTARTCPSFLRDGSTTASKTFKFRVSMKLTGVISPVLRAG